MSLIRLPDPLRAVSTLSAHDNRVVLEARGSESDEPLVVKCLTLPASEEEIADFKAEYLYLDALSHRSWAKPDVFGELPEGGYYFTLEKARGVTADRIGAMGWCPEAVEVARQILSALHVLHQSDIAQLDLKPEQILIDGWPAKPSQWDTERSEWSFPDLHVTLLDLGLARPFGTPTPGRGTVGYIAPELYHGRKDWGAATDLYSFGATMGELLGGRRLFAGANAGDIIDRQIGGRPDLLGLQLCGVPGFVGSWVLRFLSPRAEIRPEDASAAWLALRDLVPLASDFMEVLFLERSTEGTFVGRDGELESLFQWIESGGRSMGARSLTVTGEPSIGKTRFLARARAVAMVRGLRIESGSTDGAPDAGLTIAGAGGSVRMREARRLLTPPFAVAPEVAAGDPPLPADQESVELPLRALSPLQLDRVLRSLAVSADSLRTTVSESALRNPGLSRALAFAVPDVWQTIAQLLGVDSEWTRIDELKPPAEWVDHAAWALAALAADEREEFRRAAFTHGLPALAAALESDDSHPADAAVGIAPRSDLNHSPILTGFRAAVLRCAFGSDSPENQARASRALASAEKDALGQFVEYAKRTDHRLLAERALGPAILHLLEAERLERAIELYTQTQNHFSDESSLVGDDVLARLLIASILEFHFLGNRIPRLWASPVAVGESLIRRTLRLWSAIQRSDVSSGDLAVGDLNSSFVGEIGLCFKLLTLRWLDFRGEHERGEKLRSQWRAEPRAVPWQERLFDLTEFMLHFSRHTDPGYEALRDRLALTRDVAPARLAIRSENALGVSALQEQRPEIARPHLEISERMAAELDMPRARLSFLSNLATATHYSADLDLAIDRYARVLAIAMRVEDWGTAASSMSGLAVVHDARGALGLALAMGESAARLASQVRHATGDGVARNFRANQLARRASLGAPPADIGSAIETVLARPGLADSERISLLQAQAEMSWNEGDYTASRAHRRVRVDALSRRFPFRARAAIADWILLEAITAGDEFGRSLVSGLEQYPPPDRRAALADEYVSRAEAIGRGWVTADPNDPLEWLGRAYALLEGAGPRIELWLLHWRLARQFTARGNLAQGKLHWDAARKRLFLECETLPNVHAKELYLGTALAKRFLLELPSAP